MLHPGRLGLVLGRVVKGLSGFSRELPYGPHLAVATVVVILCRPGLVTLWNRYILPAGPAAPAPANPTVTPGPPGGRQNQPNQAPPKKPPSQP